LSNSDALACFDASIDASLEGKLSLPFITVIAFARALFAVVRELVTTVS
jgi:hypothetical protein